MFTLDRQSDAGITRCGVLTSQSRRFNRADQSGLLSYLWLVTECLACRERLAGVIDKSATKFISKMFESHPRNWTFRLSPQCSATG